MTAMLINEIKHPTLSIFLKGAMRVSTTVVLLYLKMFIPDLEILEKLTKPFVSMGIP